jgi:chromosome segregation ATPase
MTNEEMQSTIHFILEQQAQFSVNMEKLGDNVTRLESSVAVIAEKLDKLVEEQESLRRFVGAIAVAQATTETNLAKTNERLNTLIVVVERYISERHNGQP